MTYNFDPDRWYEMHRAQIEARRLSGQIDDDELDRALEELDRRLQEMIARLDGSYEIPSGGQN